MSMAMRLLSKRDGGNGAPITENTSDTYGEDGYPYGGDSWWWSSTGMALRYTVICIVFASILLFFLGGYIHAKRRLRKGLPLLAYHRWMVHRSMRGGGQQYRYQQPVYNPYNNQSDPYQEGYDMHGYAPPPPAYHRYGDAPPAYAPPPTGASKAMADQHYYNNPQDPRTRNEGEGSEAVATSAVPRQ